MERLNSSLDGTASVESTHAGFQLKIQPYKEPYSSEHGYLLIWVSIKYQAPNVFSDVENLFQGYLVVEPGKLSDWVDELSLNRVSRAAKTDTLYLPLKSTHLWEKHFCDRLLSRLMVL